jgi:cbb3-type cytochrome oxidase subunit 3
MLQFLLTVRPYLLVVMLGVFAALFLWAYAPRRRSHLEECGRIPLRDDQ